jgi:hypothetical protein
MGYGIAVDAQHDVYITGLFFGTRDFDPGPGTLNMTSIGSTDAFITKLDSSGSLIWAKQLGGTHEVQARGLALAGIDEIYITGWFNGEADFDPASTSFDMTAAGSYDIFLHKMKADNTGIPEGSFETAFHIYPNPTTGHFTVALGRVYDDLKIVLRNITGQVVGTRSASNNDHIDFRIDGPGGIYILEISQGARKSVTKVVKI